MRVEESIKPFYTPNNTYYFSNQCCNDFDVPGDGMKYQISAQSDTQEELPVFIDFPIYELKDATTHWKFEINTENMHVPTNYKFFIHISTKY